MIEALLAGCPVVAERRGAAPEIVEDGETGFLVSGRRGDGGRAAAARRRSTARAIQARARRRFSAERMAAEYLGGLPRRRAATGVDLGGRARGGEDGWTTLAH